MKKYFISGVLAIAISAVFTGCSKSTDLYDEGAVQQNQHEQEVAQLKKAYNDAFAKQYGTIDPNNQWGFEKTRGAFTRMASTSELNDVWIIPVNIQGGNPNKEGWNANDVAADFAQGGTPLYTLSDFDFNNYFIQHVEKENDKSILALQAWNSNLHQWENVTNFVGGDNPNGDFTTSDGNFYFKNNPNTVAQITTLMKNMGGETCDRADENGNNISIGKMFRLVRANNNFDYNYTIKWLNNYHKKPKKQWITEPTLAFKVGSSYWAMRLGVAHNTSDDVIAEGRILCEDMGANDFDFNDVVFDAKIMGNGVIKITVLAHGGTLPISIDGQLVTLPQMTNTGLADAEIQEITIPAKDNNGTPKYTDINLIPVQVVPNGDADNAYDLTAIKGAAPQKLCVPIGIDWPDEYVAINRAYTPFAEYVSISSMDDWTFTVVERLVDGEMTNND